MKKYAAVWNIFEEFYVFDIEVNRLNFAGDPTGFELVYDQNDLVVSHNGVTRTKGSVLLYSLWVRITNDLLYDSLEDAFKPTLVRINSDIEVAEQTVNRLKRTRHELIGYKHDLEVAVFYDTKLGEMHDPLA